MVAPRVRGFPPRLPRVRHDALPHPPPPFEQPPEPRASPLPLPPPLPAVGPRLRRNIAPLGQGLRHIADRAPPRRLALGHSGTLEHLLRAPEVLRRVHVEEEALRITELGELFFLEDQRVECGDRAL